LKKANVYIEPEKLERQKEFRQKLKELMEQFYHRTGRCKKAFVETYGCQQNENDSEKIKGILTDVGYELTQNAREADFILYNTCAVRENAELKVYGKLGALKALKTQNPALIIGVCGCMMQQEHIASTIRKKYRHVDLVFGTHALYEFSELLYQIEVNHGRIICVENSDGAIAEDLPTRRDETFKAWVSIMYGCNNFCSYCIVPYVRGRERSRRPEKVLEEIRTLAADGCREITLLGQNVNSYGHDADFDMDFADLLSEVCRIDGIWRVRFMTSHPKDISDKLIDTIAREEKVCHMLHLPFQAGNDRVLKEMNRKYTKEQYLDKIRRVKEKMPDMALSSDVIVGFPTETDEEFLDTLDVLRTVRFDSIYSFIYSKRQGTPAASIEEPFTREDKQKRFEKLVEVQNEISKELNEAYLGRVCRVLVEGESKNNPDFLTGRTDTNKVVNFSASRDLIGQMVNVKIIEAHTWSLLGELI